MANKKLVAQGKAGQDQSGLEAGAFARSLLGISSRQLQKAVRTKGLLVNGKNVHSKTKVKPGDLVQVLLPAEEQVKIAPGDPKKLAILYEDEWLLGVDKPAGLPTYALEGSWGLANQVAGYFLAQGRKLTPRPLHRLDTPTSGVVIFAKTAETQTAMDKLWAKGQVRRFYFALCLGQLQEAQKIELPIQGRQAVTLVRPLKVHAHCTELEAELITGRTHQIRRHLAALGHPLLGDHRYCPQDQKNPRLALHALRVSFPHPQEQGFLEVSSPIPWAEFAAYLA